MKRKKIIITLVLVMITLILLLIGVVTFIGISNSKTSGIRKNAENIIDCIINGEYSEGFYCIDTYGEIKKESTLNDFSQQIVSNMKYKLNDITVQEENETAVIQAEFETVDMQDMILQFSEYEYNQETKNLIASKIQERNFKTKKFEIQLIMVKVDGVWYLYESPEFLDVLTGGMYSMYTDIEESFLNNVTERNK